MNQILETIPISDEVSDLVQKLGSFYTEVDRDGEEAEESDVERRPFTRPFAQHTGNINYGGSYDNSTLEHNTGSALLFNWDVIMLLALARSHG